MSVLRLLIREILHRRLNFLLGLIAVTAGVAGYTTVTTWSSSLDNEVRRQMRDLGFNLWIVPAQTDRLKLLSGGITADMPQEYVDKLANSDILTIEHLFASLTDNIRWRNENVLLSGQLNEVPFAGKVAKSVMAKAVPKGKVKVGFEIADKFDLEPGGSIEIEGKTFEIIECMESQGDHQVDATFFVHLADAQEVLGRPGRINKIEALECNCASVDRLAEIREELRPVLPDTEVFEEKSIAIARAETRKKVEAFGDVLIPLMLVVVALWIGLLALGNVHQRRQEIGTLRAVGWGSTRIFALFLGKAVILGVLGAAMGYAIGTEIALQTGRSMFHLTAKNMTPLPDVFLWSLIGAPALCALASYLPAMIAVAQDPAVILVKE